MSNIDNGWIASIAISISESPDLPRLGMSGRHLTRAMETMATCLLSSGYRLAYGAISGKVDSPSNSSSW